MEYRYTKYKKAYLKDAAEMMSKTWHFDEHFQGLKYRNILYSILFKYSYYECDYCDIVVDKNERLLGFLMAGKTKQGISLKHIGIGINFVFRWIIGQFGKRVDAIKTISKFIRSFNEVMADSCKYDNEVKLFFIEENTRGMGLGKNLMNRYISHCKKNSIKSVILMTDEGCNYGFYEHYGFKQINKCHNDLSPNPELEYNSYAYALKI